MTGLKAGLEKLRRENAKFANKITIVSQRPMKTVRQTQLATMNSSCGQSAGSTGTKQISQYAPAASARTGTSKPVRHRQKE